MTKVPSGWEAYEIEFIQEVWGSMKRAEIAAKLERTPVEISKVAQRLGLRRSPKPPAYEPARPPEPLLKERYPWKPEEIAKLEKLYPDYTNATVAKMIGRSNKAVALKAQKLGLHKSQGFHSQAATIASYKREGDKTRCRLVAAIREASLLLKTNKRAEALCVLDEAIQDDDRRKQCLIEQTEA